MERWQNALMGLHLTGIITQALRLFRQRRMFFVPDMFPNTVRCPSALKVARSHKPPQNVLQTVYHRNALFLKLTKSIFDN